jgi:hypothetical protein
VAAAWQRAADSSARVLGLISVTVPELLRPHRDAWAPGRRGRRYAARQVHQRWHAYADEVHDNDLQLPYLDNNLQLPYLDNNLQLPYLTAARYTPRGGLL